MISSLACSRPARDPQWLTLEVCREFVRNKCGRSEDECKYAHPPPQVEVQNSKVICCFDSLLGRCHRMEPPCKYFHPPQHLKEQLSQARRHNLHSQMNVQPIFNLPSIMTGVLPVQNSMVVHNNPPFNGGGMVGNGNDDSYRQLLDNLLPPLHTPAPITPNWLPSLLRPSRSDRLEVCREYQRGVCTRQMSDCKFAHPPPGVSVEHDNYVTVCMDFLKERCSRETCKYFHPSLHLQSHLRASNNNNQLMQQQLIHQQLYQQQQQQQQQQLLQQLQLQQRSSIGGNSMLSGGGSSSMVAWPIMQNVPIYQQSSLILSLLSLQQQQQQQQQQLQQQQLQQQQLQQPVNQILQQQLIMSSSLTGAPSTTPFRHPQ